MASDCLPHHQVPSSDGSRERSYRLVERCRGHRAPITHVGWALDSSCMRSNCELPELRFWDLSAKELRPAEDARVLDHLRGKAWASSDGGVLYATEYHRLPLMTSDGPRATADCTSPSPLIASDDLCTA